MTDTIQPPAETLAEAMHCALKDAAAIATAEADRLAKEMPIGSRSEGTARAIAADITRLAVAALTRRAGGDAGTIDRCIEKLEQTARWSINDGRKWFNHPAANEAFEYAIAALRTVEPNAGGDAIPAGWQLVPIELPDEMAKAGAKGRQNSAVSSFRDGWKYALAATPKPPAGGDAGAVERAAGFMRHDGLCAAVGAYGYCDCGMEAAKAAALALPAPVVEGEPQTAAQLTRVINKWLAKDCDWGTFEKALDALVNQGATNGEG